ncbi:AAA family ATPase [Paraglaciecola sp. 20A4]|uniref:AAA family ATPase n=1 Tax=Paraglaciecola sp. 20A4 TaxID=2687288 RepID=UPI001408A8F4|nr:AAA family ATPase [Paraglaciecola sp. 20A4]
MTTTHFSLGKKGGIGKSQSCVFLAQGLVKADRKVALIDLDPATSTIKKYAGLEVIELVDMIDRDSGEIDPARFDELIEIANERNDLDDLIIDTGASNCITFFNYLARNDSFELFEAEGHRAIIHTVIKGGDDQTETLNTLSEINDLFPEIEKILWLNEYQHKLRFSEKGAEGIVDTKPFKDAKKKILAVFKLPYLVPATEAPQINKMNENGILFSEVKSSGLFKLAEVHRLNKYSTIVLGQIAEGMTKVLAEEVKK